jgi:hypothetical protein
MKLCKKSQAYSLGNKTMLNDTETNHSFFSSNKNASSNSDNVMSSVKMTESKTSKPSKFLSLTSKFVKEVKGKLEAEPQ